MPKMTSSTRPQYTPMNKYTNTRQKAKLPGLFLSLLLTKAAGSLNGLMPIHDTIRIS